MTAYPDGFERHTRRSGLTDPWEPIYARHAANEFRLGFRAAASHANSRGFVHGGLISALADNAMGTELRSAADGYLQPRDHEPEPRFRCIRTGRSMDRNSARSHKNRQIAAFCTSARNGGRCRMCPGLAASSWRPRASREDASLDIERRSLSPHRPAKPE
jgi:hypothetical protein